MKVSVLSTVLLSLFPGPMFGGERELNTILNGLKDAEAVCQNVSLDIKYETQLRTSSNDLVTTHTDATATFDNQGRARFESIGDIVRDTTPPKLRRMRFKATFDGQSCKALEASEDPSSKAIAGRVTPSTQQIRWLVNPRDILGSFQNKTVSEWLTSIGPPSIRSEIWQGRSVALVETPEVLDENANTLDKVSFWVDTGRSFAVVRKAYRSKPKNGDEWTETLVAEGNGYWRHETGLWLPSSYTEQSYKFTSKDQKVRDLYARHHLTLSNWRLNLTLAPTYFDMSFPPGVLVTNEVSGKTYKTGRLNDEDLTKQFEEAQAAADAAAQSARNFRWFRAGISFNLGLLTVICAVLVLRCWRRMAVA